MWSHDPWRLSFCKMASNQWYITPAEIELNSFLIQNIIRKLCEEASKQAKDKTHPDVIAAVISHFNLGPSPHGLVNNLVNQLAHSFLRWVSWFLLHVIPQTAFTVGHEFDASTNVWFAMANWIQLQLMMNLPMNDSRMETSHCVTSQCEISTACLQCLCWGHHPRIPRATPVPSGGVHTSYRGTGVELLGPCGFTEHVIGTGYDQLKLKRAMLTILGKEKPSKLSVLSLMFQCVRPCALLWYHKWSVWCLGWDWPSRQESLYLLIHHMPSGSAHDYLHHCKGMGPVKVNTKDSPKNVKLPKKHKCLDVRKLLAIWPSTHGAE